MNLSIFEVLNRMTGLQITTIPPHHTQLCFLSMYFSAARISSDGFIQMQNTDIQGYSQYREIPGHLHALCSPRCFFLAHVSQGRKD